MTPGPDPILFFPLTLQFYVGVGSYVSRVTNFNHNIVMVQTTRSQLQILVN